MSYRQDAEIVPSPGSFSGAVLRCQASDTCVKHTGWIKVCAEGGGGGGGGGGEEVGHP